MKKFSFFEIDTKFGDEILKSFDNFDFKGNKVVVELKTSDDKRDRSEDSDKSYARKEKKSYSDKPFSKKDRKSNSDKSFKRKSNSGRSRRKF